MRNKDFRYKRNIILGLIWIAIASISIYYSYDYSISNQNFSPTQPVAFSHKTHIEKYGMKCTFCHSTATSQDFSIIPSTHSCMTCHVALRNESELIKNLNLSSDNDSVLTWKRIYRLPDFVHFSHKNHLRAKIDCSSCHGEVEKLDSMKMQTRLTMKWCLQCHREPEKFVVPAREISGIFTNSDTVQRLEIISGTAISRPVFGKLKNQAKRTECGINLPIKPGRGPENCSACHH